MNFFVTVTESLGINENFSDENATDGITDPVEKAVKNISNQPSQKSLRIISE